jgi:hypothetical protein
MDRVSGTTTTINPPSDRQVKYALDLLESRVWPDGFSDEDLRGMERRVVSDLIDRLHKAPRRPSDRQVGATGFKKDEFADVPNGRYALNYEDEGWKFFQVHQGVKIAFLDLLIGSPGSYRKQSMRGAPRVKILERIQEDPRSASVNFGIQSGTCGICSSPLTNEESLKLGIGPVCRAKMGW